MIADIPDYRAADRPHQISDCKHTKRGEQLADGVLAWKEVAADRGGKIAVNCEIVPLDHIADHARSDHLAFRGGIHLLLTIDGPLSPEISRGVPSKAEGRQTLGYGLANDVTPKIFTAISATNSIAVGP